MMVRPLRLLCLALCLPNLALADRADRLQRELTPIGGERAGSADGSVPNWSGQLPPAPEGWAPGARYADPYAPEQPLFVVDAGNAAKHAPLLSAGLRALLAARPNLKLPVYPSHRDAVPPQTWSDGTAKNANLAYLGSGTGLPERAVTGTPFPILGDDTDAGLRAVWNHRLRWRGNGRNRSLIAASIASSGEVNLVNLRERSAFRGIDGEPLKDFGRSFAAVMLGVTGPKRLSGALKLTHETVDGDGVAWQRSPGPEFALFRRITESGRDAAVFGTDGLLTDDQREGYSGPASRYKWRLVGKRELIVPYHAYRLHQAGPPGPEMLSAEQPNPALLRYERHRVWVVDGLLKPSTGGGWPRRTLYLDEDSWQVLMADYYGLGDQPQRVQEVHTIIAWDQALVLPVVELMHDLPGHRYLAFGLADLAASEVTLGPDDIAGFTDDASREWAREVGAMMQR